MTQGAFRIDLNRCTGCSACAIACRIENDLPMSTTWRRVHTFNEHRFPRTALFHYSLACNHCLDPTCLEGCPARAYTKNSITGAVHLREELCIGCRYCSWVCPYEAPQFDVAAGTMSKCTFCQPRLEDGHDPACTTACPVEALEYVRDAELGMIDAPGFPETGLRPAVQITRKRRSYRPPEVIGRIPAALKNRPPSPMRQSASTSMGLRSEWSLLIFSFLAICLVAWFTARTARSETIAPLPFAAVGAVAMAVSALHLGRKTRVYRSVLNLRRSWVSREVTFFLTFYSAACALGFLGVLPHPVSWIVALVGFGALLSMDMVYRVRGQTIATIPHSAMATLTALLLVGILLHAPLLVITTGAIKLCLYAVRMTGHSRWCRPLTWFRLGIGFLIPAALLATGMGFGNPLLLGGVLVGELVDRAQFYGELEFLNPTRQIEGDLMRIAG